MARPLPPAADDPSEVKRQVEIRPEAIQVEYTEVPSALHRWATKYADAQKLLQLAELEEKAAVAKAELEAEVVEEKLRLEIRGQRSGTIDIIHAHVVSDPRYAAAHQRVIEVRKEKAGLVASAAREKAYAAGMMKAIEAKKEMLISLGAHLRQEMERDPSIRERRR